MNNKEVARRFAEGKTVCIGGKSPLAICDGVLYSYNEPIAYRQGNGRMVIYESKRSAFSDTTTRHIGEILFAASKRGLKPLLK